MVPTGTGIYAVENLYSHRIYVGSTKDSFQRRWAAHLAAFRSGKHWNPLMRSDAACYGACSFRFFILQLLPRDVQNATFERFWHHYLLAIEVPCYNVQPAAESIISKAYVPDVPPAYRYRAWDIALRCRPRCDASTVYQRRRQGIIEGIRCQSGWYFERGAIEQLRDYNERQRNAKCQTPYGLDASIA